MKQELLFGSVLRSIGRISINLLLVLCLISFAANASTITFETFPDGTPIPDSTPLSTQFPGLTFNNTTVISAFITLNEGEFPPHSGVNVAFDDGGPISIFFAAPVVSFGGYFTYAEPLRLNAFSGNTLLDSVTSLFANNELVSHDPGASPNEFLSLQSALGISRITIAGGPSGSSFTMDDLSYAPAASTVSEPGGLYLIVAGLTLVCAIQLRSRRVFISRRWLLPAAASVALLLATAVSAQTVGMPEVTPKYLKENEAADVTVTARITGPVIPTTVLLQQVDAAGKVLNPLLSSMRDDGVAPDLKKNDGIFTAKVKLTVKSSTPMLLQVSAGFTGKLQRTTCGPAPVSPVKSYLSDFTLNDIQTFLTDNNATVNSAATLLQTFDPKESFKQDWIMMTDTLSSQNADAARPRLILQNRDSTVMFGVATGGNDKDLIVEYVEWVAAEKRSRFHSINTKTGVVTANKTVCTKCHSGPDRNNANATWPYPRPNWDAYDSWGGALPYNRDRIYIGDPTPTAEQKAVQRLLKSLASDDIVKQLDLPPGITRECNGDVTIVPDPIVDGAPAAIGNDDATANTNKGTAQVTYGKDALNNITYPGGSGPLDVKQGGKYLTMHATSKGLTSDEGRGVALFDNLSKLNALRVAKEIVDKFDREVDTAGKPVKVVDIRPVALAIAKGCNLDSSNLTDYAPQAALDAFFAYHAAKTKANIKTLKDLYNDTLKKQQSLPQMKANLEAGNLKPLIIENKDPATETTITNQVAQRSVYGPPSFPLASPFSLDRLGTKFMVDREIYGQADPQPMTDPTLKIALFRLFLEPSKEPVDKWTMSINSTDSIVDHSATYTFGDVFTVEPVNYPKRIVDALADVTLADSKNSDPAKGSTKTCDQLKADSKDWFTTAFKNNPAYFK